jgi:dTDP-4-dehydrorhamnose reductase
MFVLVIACPDRGADIIEADAPLDMTRLERVLGIQMPAWQDALNAELDELAPGSDRSVQS